MSMSTLIKNALIIPMSRDGEYFYGDLLIENGKIAKIAERIETAADEIIDVDGDIVLPAFINAHTHLAMILMRNYKDDKENLQQWLAEIFPTEDKLTGEDVLRASRLGIAELIKGGCTTFSDMYFFAEETEKAVKEAGINASLGLTIFGDGEETERRYVERLPRMKEGAKDYGRICFTIAPHAIYTTDSDSYKRSKELAEKENFIIHTHLSETKKEVDDCLESTGMTPFAYLESIDALSSGNMILAHGVHLTDKELEKVRDYGLSVINNPSSNMKLTSGALDVKKLLDMGINVALGTDGASSNNNLNMLEEMHVAALSASLKAETPINAYQIIKMATINGAKALHLDDRLGSIEVGKDADIIIISTKSENMNPLNNPFSAIVYSASSEDIRTVFSHGVKVLDERRLTYADEKSIIDDVNSAWSNIIRR